MSEHEHSLQHLIFALRLQLQPVTVIPDQQEAERNLACSSTIEKSNKTWRKRARAENNFG